MMKHRIFSGLLVALCVIGCYRDSIEKGEMCVKLGDYATAIDIFSGIVKAHPDRFEARLGLGKALLQKSADLGDVVLWKEGIVQLEAAQTLSPYTAIRPLLSDAWLQRGRQLIATGDSTEGLDALARSLEYNPRSLDPLNLAGIIYFQHGDAEKAESLFAKAVIIDGSHAASRFNLGMIQWCRGAWAEAHANWLAALKASPNDPDIIYWFSRAERKIRERR